jgi:hypothetical protein
MWPFNKDRKHEDKINVTSVICIPGYWDDLIELFPDTEGRLMVVGDKLINVYNQSDWNIELCRHDPMMSLSFKVAGSVTNLESSVIAEIEAHTSVIYISGGTGDFDKAKKLAQTAGMLANKKGIAMKVESAGKAFSREKWNDFLIDGDDASIYELFVLDSLVARDNSVYSCGMHNLGLKDVIISGKEFEEGYRIVRTFNYYQVIDKPEIKVKQTFQTDVLSPQYLIIEEQHQINEGYELLENPLGMWRLI